MATGIVDSSGIITWDTVPNAGDAGNQGGDQQGGTDPTPVTGSKITVNGTDIDLSTLDDTTVAQYYGTTVATINVNNVNVEFGLFYVDYKGDYGEEGTVYLRAKSSVGSIVLNNPSLSADALAIMKQLNPKWKNNKGTVTTNAEMAAEHLCNPAVTTWSGIGDSFDEDYLNYVVGAPSLEMFLASYNAKYSSAYYTLYKTAGTYYPNPGYLYFCSNNGVTSYNTKYSNAITNEDGGIYKPSSSEWLASAESSHNDSIICLIESNGDLSHSNWNYSYGVAPLVSLKSGVDLTTSSTPGQ